VYNVHRRKKETSIGIGIGIGAGKGNGMRIHTDSMNGISINMGPLK